MWIQDLQQAHSLSQRLIYLFDQEFKKGQAYITGCGSVTFESCECFKLYYMIMDALVGQFEAVRKETLNFLRSMYA